MEYGARNNIKLDSRIPGEASMPMSIRVRIGLIGFYEVEETHGDHERAMTREEGSGYRDACDQFKGF